MAATWSNTVEWAQGQFHPQGFELGPETVNAARNVLGSGASALAGVVRMGFTSQMPRVRIQAAIRLPDNGNIIAPIDLPCIVPVELPVRIELTPEAPLPANAAVQMTAVDETSWYGRFQACLTLLLPEGAVSVRLPHWCTGVSLINVGDTANWRDAADAAVLGTFTGAANPRSRLAHFIRAIDGPMYAIAHYGL